MNPHEHMSRLILPGEGERIAEIIEREGGPRFTDEMTWTCCGLSVTGRQADVLAAAAAHKLAVHPELVGKRRFKPKKAQQEAARQSGNLASRRTDEGE